MLAEIDYLACCQYPRPNWRLIVGYFMRMLEMLFVVLYVGISIEMCGTFYVRIDRQGDLVNYSNSLFLIL